MDDIIDTIISKNIFDDFIWVAELVGMTPILYFVLKSLSNNGNKTEYFVSFTI
jgi:hypothetical protein